MRPFYIFLTLLAAGTLLAGCYKQPTPAACGEGGQTLTLKAYVEGRAGTKVDIATDTGDPTWTTGDQVKYCVTNGVTTQYNTSTVDVSASEISVTVPAGYTRANFAIYPASAAPASPTASDFTTPTVVYPTTYDLSGKTAETFSPCPMVAINSVTDLDFYHVGGLVRLHVRDIPSGTRSIDVEFHGIDHVTGTYAVANAGTLSATCTLSSGTGNVVTFTNGSSDFPTSTYLNIPVPAVNMSGLTSIFVVFKNSSGTLLSTMGKNSLWSSSVRAKGRIASYSSADVKAGFSISATNHVEFSPGNLQYQASTNTWRFAANQWTYIGNAAGNTSPSSSQSNWIDLFGWGTSGVSGYSPIATCYQPWSTSATNSQYNPYGSTSTNLYDGGANAGKADWGYNAIYNNGSPQTGWRTLTTDEWNYILSTRESDATVFGTTNARYTQATIRTDATGVNGIILFPDGVTITNSEVTTAGTVNGPSAWGTKCTAAQWTSLEAKGCVFLAAAGYRNGSTVNTAGSYGDYWSSSLYDATLARNVLFYSGNINPQNYNNRYYGFSVRLVR